MNTISPDDSKEHENHPNIVGNNSKSEVISEESRHCEEIPPVMCLFTHATDEGKRPGTCIRDIECYICEILPEPPESYTCTEWIMLLNQEYIYHDHRHQALS